MKSCRLPYTATAHVQGSDIESHGGGKREANGHGVQTTQVAVTDDSRGCEVKAKAKEASMHCHDVRKERFSRERDKLRQSKTRAVIRSFASRRSLGFLGAMRLSSSHFCSRAIMQKVDRMRCVLDTGVEQIMSRPGLRIQVVSRSVYLDAGAGGAEGLQSHDSARGI